MHNSLSTISLHTLENFSIEAFKNQGIDTRSTEDLAIELLDKLLYTYLVPDQMALALVKRYAYDMPLKDIARELKIEEPNSSQKVNYLIQQGLQFLAKREYQ